MYGCARVGMRFLVLAVLAPLAAACTTTAPAPRPAVPAKSEVPVPPAPTISFPRFEPIASVDPALAQPCITAAANKYFLPQRVISAVNSRPGSAGGTDVDLKVDLRTAVCQVGANGGVRAVIDTSPKSADQVAAEAAAARAPAAAPAPKATKTTKKK